MLVFYDMVKATTATTGSGSITVGSAVSPYRGFSGIVADGVTIRYLILDGSAWERGYGVYTSGTGVLTRNLECSSTGSLLSLSGSATVEIVAGAKDFGSGRFLLGSYSASGAASLDMTGWYSSDFDEFEIELVGVGTSSNSDQLNLRCSSDGGSTYDSGANYDQTILLNLSNTAFAAVDNAKTSAGLSGAVSSNTNYGINAGMKMTNVSGSYKAFFVSQSYLHTTGPALLVGINAIVWKSTAVCNAMKLYFATGNITGKARIYGVAK